MINFINAAINIDLVLSALAIGFMFVRFVSKEEAKKSTVAQLKDVLGCEIVVSESESIVESVQLVEEVTDIVLEPEIDPISDLDGLGVRELRPLAKSFGVRGFMKLKKAELIEAIEQAR